MKPGDNFTIAGIHRKVRNGKRRWWQFWKPRYIDGPLKVFQVVKIFPPLKVRQWEDKYFRGEE